MDGSLAANKHKEFVNSYVVIILPMAQNYDKVIARYRSEGLGDSWSQDMKIVLSISSPIIKLC
jgi:hypothetical protein